MKKLLFILPVFFLAFISNAQQTEDEVYVGKGKTFGNYNNGRGIIIPETDRTTRPINAQTAVTGMVIRAGMVNVQDSLRDGHGGLYSFDLRKEDGTIITIGTRDNGFTVPRGIVGKTISVEGKDAGQISGRRRRDGVQFTAIGVMVID
jgi:hypothetical protein